MNPSTIHVFAKWQVRLGQLDKVLAVLREVAEQSAREPGNVFYQVHQSTADQTILLLHEAYRDEAALTAHRNSEHFQNLVIGKIVPLLVHREVVLTNAIEFDQPRE